MRASATLIATIILGGLAAPAFANDVIHGATTEMGYTVHPDHAAAGKSREEVSAGIEQAKRDGTWNYYRVGTPPPVKAGTPLTRAQVEADLLRAQQHPTWSARRVGAPVTMD